MLDHYAATRLAVRTGLFDSSARPDAPVVAPRLRSERLEARARATVASRLHRIANALEPRRPVTEQSC